MNEENRETYEELVKRREAKKLSKVATSVADEQMKAFQERETINAKISTLRERMKLDKVNDAYEHEKNKIDAKHSIKKKHRSAMMLAVIGSMISFFMTLAGMSGAHSLAQLMDAMGGEYFWPSTSIALAQGSGIWLAFNCYAMKEYHNNQYMLMNIWRLTVSANSVYYNYQFMDSFNTGLHPIALGIAAGAPDIISNVFGNAAIQIKFGLYHLRGKSVGWLNRLLNVITFVPRWILWKLGDKVDDWMFGFYQANDNVGSGVNLEIMGFTDNSPYEKEKDMRELILKVLSELEQANLQVGSTIYPSKFSFTDWEWRQVRDELSRMGMFDKRNQITKLAKPIEEIKELIG